MRRVQEIGDEVEIVAMSYDAIGREYEDIIQSMMLSIGLNVKKLDIKGRQGVPDLLVSCNKKTILVECKTKKSNEATIDKEDAFEVLTKGADINADHKVTVGKPDFDIFSKSKAAGSKVITLVPHYIFIEAFLLCREGKITAGQMFDWLNIPGVALLDLLPIVEEPLR